jgi:glycosyltransferase involved in cell wall biosynthesis
MSAEAPRVASMHPAQNPLTGGGRPLRVLMVMHVPALMELGGARVQLELAEVLRARGCEVEVLSREELLGGRRRGRRGHSPDALARAAVGRVREIAAGFDVIDAHQGNLPVSKRRLGFEGLMVTRSVGLALMYADFRDASRRRWPETTRGHPLARPMRRWRKRRSMQLVRTTFRRGDMIIVPNEDERIYLQERLGVGEKTVVLPLGIAQRNLLTLQRTAETQSRAGERVAFIGEWNSRKGSHDWPEIVAQVLRRMPGVSFAFLGTRVPAETVRSALGANAASVEVVPSYASEDLPGLLDGVRAGALPSYIEGLGLGVLEKMAAGIPSVCYDVPGPRETIGRVDRSLLVPAGDTAAFAEKIVELLQLEARAYGDLSRRCSAVAEQFSWERIGAQTLAGYRERLAALEGSHASRPAGGA